MLRKADKDGPGGVIIPVYIYFLFFLLFLLWLFKRKGGVGWGGSIVRAEGNEEEQLRWLADRFNDLHTTS